MIPFARTRAGRAASGDPRLSIDERYPSMAVYTSGVDRALGELVTARLLLTEDVARERARLLRAAQAVGVQGGTSEGVVPGLR